MTIYLVRHAKAGDRERWSAPDAFRPLTKSGRDQAKGLLDVLADREIGPILSSPSTRCVETVEPLAVARGLRVEIEEALAEGRASGDVMDLVGRAGNGTVLCTHGDIVELVIAELAARGVSGADPSLGKKGSTWIIEPVGASPSASYVPPPGG